MHFIFSKLPLDIIKNILLFDEHFKLRKGEIVSIIPKLDYRYGILNYITYHYDYIERYNGNMICHYYFPNLYNYEGRRIYNSDLIQVTMCPETNNTIKYKIWIGRQKPKSCITNKRQDFYIENPMDYHWVYTDFEFIRF
jgi:hypothetical protein